MPQVRHDWYQTESQVTVEILLKNQKAEHVNVAFTIDSLSVSVNLPSEDYELKLKLANEINPELSSFKVLPSKIEIHLRKTAAVQWSSLEQKLTESTGVPVSYPSSSSKKHDWDKLGKEIDEEDPQGEEAVQSLFKKIYQDGNDEVRRAMNKSFMESSGTVLSTNWGDVGKKKVDVKAPDGTDFKKFT